MGTVKALPVGIIWSRYEDHFRVIDELGAANDLVVDLVVESLNIFNLNFRGAFCLHDWSCRFRVFWVTKANINTGTLMPHSRQGLTAGFGVTYRKTRTPCECQAGAEKIKRSYTLRANSLARLASLRSMSP